MVGEHLRVIFRPAELLEPLRDAEVLLGTFAPGDLSVSNVTDEQVPEGVLGVAGNRRGSLTPHELLPLEGVKPLLERAGIRIRERFESTEPERLPDDCGVLDQPLLLGLEQIETSGDHALHRLGQLLDPAVLPECPRELLGVQRITARAGQQFRLRVGRQDDALEQLAEEAGGVLVGER